MARFRCFSCGRFTDEVVDGGPTANEAEQSHRWVTCVLSVGDRAAVCCWVCFWATEPDMWINEKIWSKLKPQVPFDLLPKMLDFENDFRHEDPASYPWPSGVSTMPCSTEN